MKALTPEQIRAFKQTTERIKRWRTEHNEPIVVRLSTGGLLELKHDVPRTRGECVDAARPCPHYKCRYHLWRIDEIEMPGRPWYGKRPDTTLRAAWLEKPLPPTCALDEAERLKRQGAIDNDDVGAAMGKHRTLVGRIARKAMIKLRVAGVDLRDLVEVDHKSETKMGG